MSCRRGNLASVVMSHVLSREKREQVIALGRLGWSLRRIEQATGVRRETAGDYLRGRGDCPAASRRLGTPQSFKSGHRRDHRLFGFDPGRNSKPAIEVITGFFADPGNRGCGPASQQLRTIP